MYKRIVASLALVAFLCGCAAKQNTNNNTTSNNSSANSESTTTTIVAQPVGEAEDLSIEKIIWGPGNIVEHQQPIDPVNLKSRYASLDGYWLLDDEKKVCLTFDEGYENGYTPSILDTLKEKNVKAIFFVTYDFASQNHDLIERMIEEGHIVGNHTWHHYDMTEIDTGTAKEEISYLHKYIKDSFNYTMSCFRFPEGSFSEQSLGIVKSLGYKSVFWSFAYADWDVNKQVDESKALQNITNSTHNGEIILLHAVSETNAKILGKVIDEIRNQGYDFTTEI